MKVISILLLIVCVALGGWLLYTDRFTQTRSYEYEGEIEPSHILVSDIYEQNHKINTLLTALTETEYFRIFRVNLARDCPFWSRSGKCRLNQCPIEEEDREDRVTHVGIHLVDRTLTPEDKEFTKHIPIEEYSDDHNGERWIADEHLDTDGVFVDLIKNPERYSGYNGSEIWHELWQENILKLQFPTHGNHEDFLYRIVSGVQVNINSHISHYYLEDLEHAHDVQLEDFQPNYSIFYERIGKHPDRIKNLFYLYAFLLHTTDVMKDSLPYYVYYKDNQLENDKMQNRMKWLGHYINGLLDPESIESGMFDNISRREFTDYLKPAFINTTTVLE